MRPQEGPQTRFLATPADIALFGGAAGGGKSYALLFEALRHCRNPLFTAVFFRRTKADLTKPGGLKDTANEIYPLMGARSADLEWTFRSGAKVTLDGMEHEKDRLKWQGTQMALIGFDEVTHFTATQFWYMLSRNRSASGIPGYIRAGCNPDPDSFVRQLIDWWIGEDGFPIPERDGRLRWFIREGQNFIWADTREELIEQHGPDQEPKSLTFIHSRVHDNKILLAKNPGYLSSLKALSHVDRAQLLDGNWNIRAAAGMFFKRQWFEVVDAAPAEAERCRYWDRAATRPTTKRKPDWTAGARLARTPSGIWFIEDMRRMQDSPMAVNQAMRNTAQQDPPATIVAFNQDPGSAGVYEAQDTARFLEGFDVRFEPATGTKLARAKPVSAQCEAGNVKIVRGPWNEALLNELENFDGQDGNTDDQVDGLSGAFNTLANRSRIYFA